MASVLMGGPSYTTKRITFSDPVIHDRQTCGCLHHIYYCNAPVEIVVEVGFRKYDSDEICFRLPVCLSCSLRVGAALAGGGPVDLAISDETTTLMRIGPGAEAIIHHGVGRHWRDMVKP